MDDGILGRPFADVDDLIRDMGTFDDEPDDSYRYPVDDLMAQVADLERLRQVMLRCADKLEEFGNEEPRAVAAVLRHEAGASNGERS